MKMVHLLAKGRTNARHTYSRLLGLVIPVGLPSLWRVLQCKYSAKCNFYNVQTWHFLSSYLCHSTLVSLEWFYLFCLHCLLGHRHRKVHAFYRNHTYYTIHVRVKAEPAEGNYATVLSLLFYTIFLGHKMLFYVPVVRYVSKSLSHVWVCDPMDCSPPGSSVHGILQARTLEWIAILFFRASSPLRIGTWVSCIAGRFFTIWATREAVYPN